MTLQPDEKSAPRRAVVRIAVVVAIVLVAWYVLKDLPWDLVGAALTQVSALEVLALLGLVVLRAFVAALPLNVLMPEVSPGQATRNDLAGNLVANFAPPPSDVGIRYAMFRSWHVNAAEAMASLSLSALLFYAGRFGAPIMGFTLVLLTRRFDDQYLVMAAVATLVAVLIVAAIILLARAERSAAWLGRRAARAVSQVREVDPAAWESAMVKFHETVSARLQRGWAGAVLAVVGLLVLESLILILCMRFVGVPPESVVAVEIAGALLITYPLNMLPFGGIVILDGLILEILMAQGGGAFEAQLAAGLVLWRAATLVTPFVLGAIVLLRWQRREGSGVTWRRSPEAQESG